MLVVILLILSSIGKAIMDSLQFHFDRSIFNSLSNQYWNPEVSWRNKYKDGDPTKGARFFGSTTFLVFITDGWHLSQFIFLNFFMLALVNYKYTSSYDSLIDFLLFSLIFKGVFEIFYSQVFYKKIK
jgi:hypothetical protein